MQHAPISRDRYMGDNRKMRFTQAYDGWSGGRLTQAETALLLGQCECSFRPHIEPFKADGLEGLLDKRLSQISKRRASGAEVDHVVQLYKATLLTAIRRRPSQAARSKTGISDGKTATQPSAGSRSARFGVSDELRVNIPGTAKVRTKDIE